MREDDAAQKGIERGLGDRYQIVRTLGRGAFGAGRLAAAADPMASLRAE